MSKSITSVALAVALIATGWSYAQVATPQDAQQRQEAQQQQQQREAQQQREIQQRQGVQQQRGIQQQQQLERREHEARFRGEAAVHRHTEAVRVSELMGVTGLTVRNLQDENLGSINDIVIADGCVKYVVLSVGGFLGIGDRMVAVPWEAFQHQRDEDGDYAMVLNVDRERLEQAPAFDADERGDFGDPGWTGEIDAFYEGDVRTHQRRELRRDQRDIESDATRHETLREQQQEQRLRDPQQLRDQQQQQQQQLRDQQQEQQRLRQQQQQQPRDQQQQQPEEAQPGEEPETL